MHVEIKLLKKKFTQTMHCTRELWIFFFVYMIYNDTDYLPFSLAVTKC